MVLTRVMYINFHAHVQGPYNQSKGLEYRKKYNFQCCPHSTTAPGAHDTLVSLDSNFPRP